MFFFQFDNILNTLYGIRYPGKEATSPSITVFGFQLNQNIMKRSINFFLFNRYINPFSSFEKLIIKFLFFSN